MIQPFRNRGRSAALQGALERYNALIASGTDPVRARLRLISSLEPGIRTAFVLAAGLGDPAIKASSPLPDPAFVDAFEARLRRAKIVRKPILVTRPRLRLAPLALAACVAVLAALLVPALRSIPGDPLYALKTATEDTRVLIASGPAEAKIRISLANERYREVELLVARSRVHALAAGDYALAVTDADIDPHLAELIQATLEAAGAQISKAAAIIIDQHSDATGLDQLVAVSRRGQALAENVAADLPHSDKPPVLKTAVTLAKIEAQANAARMTIEAAPTQPGPCATATPTPTPAETTPTPTSTLAPTETPSGPTTSPEPTQTPATTPCISPTPAPTPTAPVTTPEPSAEVTPSATDQPGETASDDGNQAQTQQQPSSEATATDAQPGRSSG